MTEPQPIEGWDNRQMFGTGDLAVFLGGSETSFTGLLLVLMQKADPGNLSRLRLAFPREVKAWETWNSTSPVPTFAELREALADAETGDALMREWRARELPAGHKRITFPSVLASSREVCIPSVYPRAAGELPAGG
jgi:hypothetical protein